MEASLLSYPIQTTWTPYLKSSAPIKRSGCEELLDNIKTTLQECSNNRKYFYMNNLIRVNSCKNIDEWSNDVLRNIGIKLNIKTQYLKGVYYIDYNIKNKLVTIN